MEMTSKKCKGMNQSTSLVKYVSLNHSNRNRSHGRNYGNNFNSSGSKHKKIQGSTAANQKHNNNLKINTIRDKNKEIFSHLFLRNITSSS